MEKKEYQIIDIQLLNCGQSAKDGPARAKEISKNQYALSVMADDAGKFSPSLLQKY